MTDWTDELDQETDRLCREASEEPWHFTFSGHIRNKDGDVATGRAKAIEISATDAAFIRHARTALPIARAEIHRLRREVEDLEHQNQRLRCHQRIAELEK